jgi:hypothetical protein
MFWPTVAIIRFYPKLYAKKKVSIQRALLRNHVEISSSTCQAKFIPYGLSMDSVSCWNGPVLLTVVIPPNSYYTQQEWHTSKFFNSFHYTPFLLHLTLFADGLLNTAISISYYKA